MIVLVTGGREYDNAELVECILDGLHRYQRITLLVHGGATGADTLADQWAHKRRVRRKQYEVTKLRWKLEGRRAGHNRNVRMLDIEKPNLVVAFPGGPGTRDCVREAKHRKIARVVVERPG